MKAFRNIDTLIQFTDGFLVYYNYLKPHSSLKGKTPAEAARVDYEIKNWMDVVRIQSPISRISQSIESKTNAYSDMPDYPKPYRRMVRVRKIKKPKHKARAKVESVMPRAIRILKGRR